MGVSAATNELAASSQTKVFYEKETVAKNIRIAQKARKFSVDSFRQTLDVSVTQDPGTRGWSSHPPSRGSPNTGRDLALMTTKGHLRHGDQDLDQCD